MGMWYWIVLIWFAAVAGIVWAYRRKRQRLAAARDRQAAALLAEFKVRPGLAAGNTVDGQAAKMPLTPPVRTFSRKPRVLPQSAALLYYVFRTGLPDHEILAGLALSDLIDAETATPGYDREQTARRLANCRLDLVVCTKQLEVVAVVMLGAGTGADAGHAENSRFASECLQSAGVRTLHIDSRAPPRHHQVRDLIYRAD